MAIAHASIATIERLIVGKVVSHLVGNFDNIEVTDQSGQLLIRDTDDEHTVMAAVFSCDARAVKIVCQRKPEIFWVKFVFGNGTSVISDWSINVEELLEPALALAKALEG